jgi:hypothetical protein
MHYFTARFLFLFLAALCFFLAAIGVGTGRLNLVALGLFFWIVTLFLQP